MAGTYPSSHFQLVAVDLSLDYDHASSDRLEAGQRTLPLQL